MTVCIAASSSASAFFFFIKKRARNRQPGDKIKASDDARRAAAHTHIEPREKLSILDE